MGNRGRTASLRIVAPAAALVLALSLMCSSAVSAQNAGAGQMIVQKVDLVDADLQAAVRMLTAQTGVEIVIEASDKPYGRVNLMLEKKSLDTVLQMICTAAGCSVRVQDGVYVIGPKSAATAEPPKPAETPTVAPEPVLPKRYRTERIRLQNARPSEIVAFLTRTEFGDRSDFMRQMWYETVGMPKRPYGNVNNPTPATAMQPPVNGAPQVVPTGPKANAPTEEENQFGMGVGGGRMGGGGYGGGQMGGGYGGYGGGQMGGGYGGYGGGQMGGGLGRGGGQLGGGGGIGGGGVGASSLVPQNIESMLAYDIDNTIIVRTSDDDALTELKNIIRLLDIAPKQLMIKVEFVEASQNDLRQFGVDWQLARGNLVAGNPGFAAGQVFMNYATGNIAAQLRSTLTEGKGRLISSPMVTTLNNLPVSLSIGREIPVFITSPTAGGNGVVVLQTQLQTVQAASGMDVLARINGDDTISLTIAPFVQDVSGQVTGPEGTTAPIVSYQSIGPITRRVRNGDTMAIAGLVTKNDGTSIKKVPLFGDLPLIGQLFQSREYRVADSELLVFVTPSILPDPIGSTGSGMAATGTITPP